MMVGPDHVISDRIHAYEQDAQQRRLRQIEAQLALARRQPVHPAGIHGPTASVLHADRRTGMRVDDLQGVVEAALPGKTGAQDLVPPHRPVPGRDEALDIEVADVHPKLVDIHARTGTEHRVE